MGPGRLGDVIPTSTYRLQITPDFRLQDAAEVIDHLDDLGVGAVYLSPVLTSTVGSQHGYDVTDPTRIDPQRGGEEGWQALVAAARRRNIGLILDIVPNHLGVSAPVENPAWWSVLAEGARSEYAPWFDINWEAGRISIPVLGADGDLSALMLSDDATELRFYDHRFPVARGTARHGDDARAVHDRQHYELIPGAQGSERLTYRRFFTVETLAGLRIEDPLVLEATHSRVLRMVAEGEVVGLRVDHPDGLTDPGEYFQRLRAATGDLWIVAEKILEHGESMPTWAVQGTTGYDAMTEVNQLFIDPAAEGTFTVDYQRRTGDLRSVEDHILVGKTRMAGAGFVTEVNRIMSLLDLEGFPAATIRAALVATAVRLDVYRTYLPEDHAALDAALARATRDEPALAPAIAALAPILLDVRQEAARRFQQLTGAVMAKGVEDTAWYRANRFVALNEVGGHPSRFGLHPDAFHRAMAAREKNAPLSMTSLATHDTKRGEDVRARLAGLAELPDEWGCFLDVFTSRTNVSEPTFAHLLAQTLAATGPVDPERLHAYAEKAMREASLATSWQATDTAFEGCVHAAIEVCTEDAELNAAWRRLHEAIIPIGAVNSLGQKLVQLTMPGIPDVYQGTEVWDDSLVDPDNRRPVDFDALRILAETTPTSFLDPAYKLQVVRTALRLRRDQPDRFHGYRPIQASGPSAQHLLAFERDGVITLATRLPRGLALNGGWPGTSVSLDGIWVDLLTGTSHCGSVGVEVLLSGGPVALLVRD